MRTFGTLWAATVVFGCLISLPQLQAQTPDLSHKVPSHSVSAKHRTRGRHKRVPPPPITLAQVPLRTPLPWLDFMPAGPVTINYQAGELTINAFNTPLGDVLHQVCKKLGASVELPPGANDPVFGQIGPGPARDVVASLLYGVNFNYVISVSAEDPNRLERVVLSPKPPPPPAGDKKRAQ
jgi:hypothetical protein